MSAEDETWRISQGILKCTRKRLFISAPQRSVSRKVELHRETVITILLLHSRRTKKRGKKEDFIWKNKTFEISPASHFLFLGMQEFQLILHVPNSSDTVLMIALFPPPQVQLLLQVPLLSVAGHLTTASAQAAVRNLVGGATAAKNNSIFFFP